jgi:hypothetical protein
LVDRSVCQLAHTRLATLERNLSHRLSIIERKVIWRRTAAATIAVLLLPGTLPLQASSQQSWSHSRGTEVWRRVNVTILARGSHVSDGAGNMDSYLVLLSERKTDEPVAARLVDYYAGFQEAITDEVITSHRQFWVFVFPSGLLRHGRQGICCNTRLRS